MSGEFIIEIPEYFCNFKDGSPGTRWCFHNFDRSCPFAWRDPSGHYWIDNDDNMLPAPGDKVHCTLGLNDADTVDSEYHFSSAGPGCPGPGKYKLEIR